MPKKATIKLAAAKKEAEGRTIVTLCKEMVKHNFREIVEGSVWTLSVDFSEITKQVVWKPPQPLPDWLPPETRVPIFSIAQIGQAVEREIKIIAIPTKDGENSFHAAAIKRGNGQELVKDAFSGLAAVSNKLLEALDCLFCNQELFLSIKTIDFK